MGNLYRVDTPSDITLYGTGRFEANDSATVAYVVVGIPAIADGQNDRRVAKGLKPYHYTISTHARLNLAERSMKQAVAYQGQAAYADVRILHVVVDTEREEARKEAEEFNRVVGPLNKDQLVGLERERTIATLEKMAAAIAVLQAKLNAEVAEATGTFTINVGGQTIVCHED